MMEYWASQYQNMRKVFNSFSRTKQIPEILCEKCHKNRPHLRRPLISLETSIILFTLQLSYANSIIAWGQASNIQFGLKNFKDFSQTVALLACLPEFSNTRFQSFLKIVLARRLLEQLIGVRKVVLVAKCSYISKPVFATTIKSPWLHKLSKRGLSSEEHYDMNCMFP